MSPSGRPLLEMLRASMLLSVLGLIIGPQSLVRKLDEAWVGTWKTLADSVLQHDMASLSRQLDQERGLLSRMCLQRDALVTRLQNQKLRTMEHQLAGLRQCRRRPSVFITDGLWDEGDQATAFHRPSRQDLQSNGEPLRTDDVFVAVVDEVKRIDHQIETAERALQGKDRELFLLGAMVEGRRIRQELAETGGALSWNARVGRVSEFLRPISVTPNPD